jgi:site-specific DNA recombinase
MSLTANSSKGVAKSMLRLKKELQKFMALKEPTLDILHRLVDKIVVMADGSLNIHYKFTATALLTT